MEITHEGLTIVTITKRILILDKPGLLVIEADDGTFKTRYIRRFTIDIDEADLKELIDALDCALDNAEPYRLLDEQTELLTELVAGLRHREPITAPPYDHDGSVEGWLGGVKDLNEKAKNFGPSFSDSGVKYPPEDN